MPITPAKTTQAMPTATRRTRSTLPELRQTTGRITSTLDKLLMTTPAPAT